MSAMVLFIVYVVIRAIIAKVRNFLLRKEYVKLEEKLKSEMAVRDKQIEIKEGDSPQVVE